MPGSSITEGVRRDVIAVIASIPSGRIATHGSIGRHLGIAPRQVAAVVAALDDETRGNIPWWRVLADGGAVGRHPRRDEQMQRLRAEGIPVAPVGIAGELAARRFQAFGQGRAENASADDTQPAPGAKRSLSRGMKSHPEKR